MTDIPKDVRTALDDPEVWGEYVLSHTHEADRKRILAAVEAAHLTRLAGMTDKETMEKAAESVYDAVPFRSLTWKQIPRDVKDTYRRHVQAAAPLLLASAHAKLAEAERELATERETNLDNCDRADWYKAQIENPKMWPGRVPTEQVEQVKLLAEQAKTRCAECGGTGVRKVMRFTDTCPFCTHGQIATTTEGDTR